MSMVEGARPLFIFVNGDLYFESMWHDGPIQPEWVAESLDIIAAPAANVADGPLAGSQSLPRPITAGLAVSQKPNPLKQPVTKLQIQHN